ncbi:MAG: BMP family ABC transporter substrate-binding protein [Acidimicrobiales bacterium]|nr:BMP family ABC transporter substrate-binding protein [Acidimicrobiales bacterium]
MFRSTSERRRRRLLPLALVAVLALLGAGCGGDDSGDDSGTGNGSGDDVVTAGFIYIGPINDGGWTQAHEAGRADAAETLGDTAELTYKENVPEGPEAAQAMRDMIADGADIIFANSFGYGDAIKEVAAEHPDVKFEHATGLDTGGLPNVATYFGASEDTIYLTGLAAGAAIPEGGTVGFVAPFAIPEVIRHINAFQVGVAEVNPTATTKVVWTNTWFDPETERQAADSLIADGVDAIASGQDSPASGEAANEAGLPFVGYDSDQSENLPEVWLTASLYHWGTYYAERIQAVIDGTWETGDYYGGIADGFVSLAPFGDLVTQETRDLIGQREDDLVSGDFYEFAGPLVDQDGTERVPEGESMSLEDILAMDWFIDGVDGDASP